MFREPRVGHDGDTPLGDFRRDGLLDTVRHRVVIRDAERLAEVADG